MKIAFICELIGTERHGGEQYAMSRVADSIKKLNNEVDIYSYVNKNKELEITSNIPLKFRLLPFIRDIFFVPLIGKNIFRKIELKYDFINSSSTTIAAFYKPKTKLLITCHIIRSQKFETMSKIPKYKILFNPLTYFVISYLEKKSLHNADKIVVILNEQKLFLQNKFGINSNNIAVIPNGIDTQLFKPLNVEKKNQVIFVGRGTIPKGLDYLLEAIININADLLIVTKKIDKDLEHIANSNPRVKIKYDATPLELVNLYAESKLFVLPSLDEVQPLTIIEAMSCGLPIITTKIAASNLVSNNINGLVVTPFTSENLAESCNALLNDPASWLRMSDTNTTYVANNFDIHKVALKTLEFMRSDFGK